VVVADCDTNRMGLRFRWRQFFVLQLATRASLRIVQASDPSDGENVVSAIQHLHIEEQPAAVPAPTGRERKERYFAPDEISISRKERQQSPPPFLV